MGLDSRDWYREEPSKAWANRWTSTATKRTILLRPGVGAAIVVSAVVSVGGAALLGSRMPFVSSTPKPAASPVDALHGGSKVVRLAPSAGLDIPASRVTKWTLSDPRFGLVEVFVPVGQTPRQALTLELAQRGYQVVS